MWVRLMSGNDREESGTSVEVNYALITCPVWPAALIRSYIDKT